MIKIEINCEPYEYDEHIRALGFMRNPVAALGEKPPAASVIALATPKETMKFVGPSEDAQQKPTAFETSILRADAAKPEAIITSVSQLPGMTTPVKANPDRPWGQPSPGKKRRNGAEVAEDEAHDAERTGLAHGGVHPSSSETTVMPPSAGISGNISTGEERIDPYLEGITAKNAAQDAADEAAETAARTGPLTLEDVRRAVAKWSEVVGPARAIKDLRTILGCTLIELPEAEWANAISRLEHATAHPEIEIAGVAAPDPKPKATKDEVTAALKAYGKMYDGTEIPDEMTFTKEDMPKILERVFGKGVVRIGLIPNSKDAYGQAVAAITAATQNNTFKREVRT